MFEAFREEIQAGKGCVWLIPVAWPHKSLDKGIEMKNAMKRVLSICLPVCAVITVAGCAGGGMNAPATPAAIPVAVAVPAGQKTYMTLTGVGEITYECRAKATKDGFEWAFAGPAAVLYDANKVPQGKYYGGPTWEANDGSKVTGKQLAVSPAAPGNIALQLVQANPAMGNGAMQGVTYIQRLNTVGGVAPSEACGESGLGMKKQVKYQADYVFYKG
jgi:Protein of unknown function (DUF3455)